MTFWGYFALSDLRPIIIIPIMIVTLHKFLLSLMLEWCRSYQIITVTMWLCIIVMFYVIIVHAINTLFVLKFDDESDHIVRICEAIQNKDVVGSIRLLEDYPQYINAYTEEGYTPFLIACANGNTQLVKLMLRKGADIRLKSAKKESPFYLAAFYYIKYPRVQDATCIRELFYAGADINEPTDRGLTALQMAAMFGHTALVKWMLLKNASIRTNPDPYLIACTQGHQETAKLIWRLTMTHALNYK